MEQTINRELNCNLLTKQHLEDLKKSGLSNETINKYDFSSIDINEATKELGYKSPSGGWLLRYPDSGFFKIKPDKPYTPDRKYESPKGMTQDFFITNRAKSGHDDELTAFYFIEGEKKALALEQAGYAAISIPGVWGWKSRGHTKEQLGQLNLSDRDCYIIFDSDKYTNEHVRKAERDFAEELSTLGASVKIVNLDPMFGKGADDQLLKLGPSDFQYYIDKAQSYAPDFTHEILCLPPISLPEFLKKDIPSVEYYVEGILQKSGKAMVSAQTNIGKSIFVQNLALSMTAGHTKLMDKFTVEQAKVLYLDLEMGESALYQRFKTMCAKDQIIAKDLYVRHLPDFNILKPGYQRSLEKWISDLGIKVLILDPLSNSWAGDPNDGQQVGQFTAYLNTLIAKYSISVLIVHHWRKATKDFKGGSEMAAGSFRWGGWLDNHITLQGAPDSITISFEKSRNASRLKPFLAKINDETLSFEFITDYEKKFTDSTLGELFNSFGMDRVAVPELIKRAVDEKKCSKTTIRKLIDESTFFKVDRSQKTHYLVKKGVGGDFCDENELG